MSSTSSRAACGGGKPRPRHGAARPGGDRPSRLGGTLRPGRRGSVRGPGRRGPRVTGTLVGRLEDARRTLSQRRPKSDLKAYDIYLRARQHFFNLSPDDNRKAAELLEAAIGIEPNYAAALALLSEVYYRAWINGWSDDPKGSFEEAHRTALKAVELDEEDSRTHTALGFVCLFRGQHDQLQTPLQGCSPAQPERPARARTVLALRRFERRSGARRRPGRSGHATEPSGSTT